MKRKMNLCGIIAFAAIIGLSFSLLTCGEESNDSGPKIPSLSVPRPADINADISGSNPPVINNDADAVEFLTTAFSFAASNMQMPDMSFLQDILSDIMSDINIPINIERKIITDSQSITIDLAEYAEDLDDYGIKLKGIIAGSFSYSYDDVTYAMSANGKINADCSLGYDISENNQIDTDDVFVMDLKFKANGSMLIKMSETEERVSVTAGAAASLALAFKNEETNTGAKIILTAGYAGSVNMDIRVINENAMPDLGNFNGDVTLAIYNANNALIYNIKMSYEDLMNFIETVSEDIE